MSGHNGPQSEPLIQSRYQIQRKLGQGSMGEVLLVYDVYMERSVAMKLIRLPKKLTEIDLLRFIEEAKCQGQLQHPGIISVYDIGQTQDGRIFFTMRAVEGIEFSTLIKIVHQTTSVQGLWGVSEEGWSFRRLIQALKQCADAVGFAHDQGVVHRDLKPQNLMIGSHREPLVLDWGVAKLLESDEMNDSSRDHKTQETLAARGHPPRAEPSTSSMSSAGSNPSNDEFELTPTLDHIIESTLDLPPPQAPVGPRSHHAPTSITGEDLHLPEWFRPSARVTEVDETSLALHDTRPNRPNRPLRRLIQTIEGTVTGTPAYMSPEQAHGHSTHVNATTDVYALGCILYHILCGAPPYQGTNLGQILQRVRDGHFPQLIYNLSQPLPSTPARRHSSDVDDLEPVETSAPEALIRICAKAMSHQQADRYPNARAFADALDDWISGVQQRQEALRLIGEIKPLRRQQADLEREATALDQQGRLLLKEIPTWANEREKWSAWMLEDQARAIRAHIEDLDFDIELKVQGALSLAGELPEIHLEAAQHYLATHQRLVEARRVREARRVIAHLETHTHALPDNHPGKPALLTYLRGEGDFILTLPKTSSYQVYMERLVNRRLITQTAVTSDLITLNELDVDLIQVSGRLPSGSYRCVIQSAVGEITYPLLILAGQTWDSTPPHSNLQKGGGPLWKLPQKLAIAERYIPAGWAFCGDREAPRSSPPMKLWIDSFVVCEHPVTHRQYLIFLNDLHARGSLDLARRHAPQELGASPSEQGSLLYTLDDQGYHLPDNATELGWSEDSPVVMVNWWDACAYAQWRAQRDHKPWRLLSEWEWEKAARGVDGRAYPWGTHIDPSWCCNRLSHQTTPGTTSVGMFEVDTSPYNVKGMAGNTADWCLTPHEDEPRVSNHERAPRPSLSDALNSDLPARVAKGGAWDDGPAFCHTAVRHRGVTHYRRSSLSFRIAYSS